MSKSYHKNRRNDWDDADWDDDFGSRQAKKEAKMQDRRAKRAARAADKHAFLETAEIFDDDN